MVDQRGRVLEGRRRRDSQTVAPSQAAGRPAWDRRHLPALCRAPQTLISPGPKPLPSCGPSHHYPAAAYRCDGNATLPG